MAKNPYVVTKPKMEEVYETYMGVDGRDRIDPTRRVRRASEHSSTGVGFIFLAKEEIKEAKEVLNQNGFQIWRLGLVTTLLATEQIEWGQLGFGSVLYIKDKKVYQSPNQLIVSVLVTAKGLWVQKVADRVVVYDDRKAMYTVPAGAKSSNQYGNDSGLTYGEAYEQGVLFVSEEANATYGMLYVDQHQVK